MKQKVNLIHNCFANIWRDEDHRKSSVIVFLTSLMSFLMSLLLNLNLYHTFFVCLFYSLWTKKYLWGKGQMVLLGERSSQWSNTCSKSTNSPTKSTISKQKLRQLTFWRLYCQLWTYSIYCECNNKKTKLSAKRAHS